VRRRSLVLAALWLANASGPARAQTSGDLERALGLVEAEEIEKIPLGVTSRGEAIPAGLAPAVVDVITADEIHASGARTLAELLAQRVGMDVSLDRVVARGLNATASDADSLLVNRRVLVLINGRPSNGVALGEFAAGRELPLEHIARVEVIRGPGSALYGTNAMSGVVNLVTKDAADLFGLGVDAQYGSFSTGVVDLHGGVGGPRRNASFFLRRYGSEDAASRGDDEKQYYGFAQGVVGPLTIESELVTFRIESGRLIPLAGPFRRERFSIGGRLDHPLGKSFHLRGQVYGSLNDQRIASQYETTTRGTVVERHDYEDTRVGEELSLHYRARDWLAVTVGGELRQESGKAILNAIGSTGLGRVGPFTLFGPFIVTSLCPAPTIEESFNCPYHQNIYGAFLEDRVALPKDVTLTAGVRLDKIEGFDPRANPRGSLVWRAYEGTIAKLGYGEAFRVPNFFERELNERFGTGPRRAGVTVSSARSLDREIVRTVDAEISRRFTRHLNLRLAAFWSRASDLIVDDVPTDCIDPEEEGCVTFRNMPRARVAGVEIAVGGTTRAPLGGDLSYGLNYTFQDTSGDFAGGDELPVAPPNKVNLILDYRPRPNLSIFWRTRWVDSQFTGTIPARLGSFFDHAAQLRYRISREVELGVGFYNVSDESAPEAVGIAREPFSALGTVSYHFSPSPALLQCPWLEPSELAEARGAVERARAAGAERLNLPSYREALRDLGSGEALQARCAQPRAVITAARRATAAAEAARAEVAAAPAPPSAPAAPITAGGRVLVLQSDSKVTAYRAVSGALVPALGDRVEFHDCQGHAGECKAALAEHAAAVDLVVAVGTVAATEARAEHAGRTVLYCGVTNPRRYDLVTESMCGVSLDVPAEEFLARVLEALPGKTRIGILHDPTRSGPIVLDAQRAATALGLRLVKAEVRDPRDVAFVLRSVAPDVDLMWLVADATVLGSPDEFDQLSRLSLELRKPLVASFRSERGVVLAAYPEPEDIGARCAEIARRLLRSETTCRDIGYATPRKTAVAWSSTVADQFGLTLPPAMKIDERLP
jgi:iron complex outermembrane receptor protein